MAVRVPAPLAPVWGRLKVVYRNTTRVISPFTRQASRIRGGYLPRGAVATADESVAEAGGHVWVARPEERVEREVPVGEPPRHGMFVRHTDLLVPRVAVAELPEGRVLSEHRVVIDRLGNMVEEFGGIYWGTLHWSQHRIFWHPFPEPPLEVSGLLGVLAGRGDASYFHFLLDIFPRLAILETPGVPEPEQWYAPLGSDQRQLLELAGFLPREGIIDADAAPHVRAERLLVPGFPDQEMRTPPWTIGFIRERLRPPDAELVPGRRLYVTRGQQRHNRIVLNEAEVVEMLGERGFEVMDPSGHTVAEEIRIFAEAECVVSPHGGALTNIVFASPGASVVELFPPRYVQPSYWKVAESVPGLNYRYLLGEGRRSRSGNAEIGVVDDITVNLAALARTLDSLGIGAAPAAKLHHQGASSE